MNVLALQRNGEHGWITLDHLYSSAA